MGKCLGFGPEKNDRFLPARHARRKREGWLSTEFSLTPPHVRPEAASALEKPFRFMV